MKNNIIKCFLIFALCFSLTTTAKKSEYKTIQWVDLMPQEDMSALYDPPEELFDIPEGGAADDVSSQVFNTLMQAMDSEYQRALSSTHVMPELNNKKIKIPGFVVPVKIEGDKTTEFFIVPYFGACIHYPPPPPNQTIFAVYKPGFSLEEIYEPFYFSGLLTTSIKEDDLATSAYHLMIGKVDAYTE